MKKLWYLPFLVVAALLGCGDHGKHSPLGPSDDGTSANKPATTAFNQEVVPTDTLVSSHLVLRDRLGRQLNFGLASVSVWQGRVRYDSVAVDLSQKGIFLFVPFAPGDWDLNGWVNFADFFAFATHFGLAQGEEGFSSRFDMDGSGRVDFPDFLIFADNFNARLPGAAAKVASWPDTPPLENRGRVSESEFRDMWETLQAKTRVAAKVATSDDLVEEPGFEFRVQALDSSFAPLDTTFTGSFAQLRELTLEVNIAPRTSRPAERLPYSEGDSINVPLSGVFYSDDLLTMAIVSSDNGLALSSRRIVGRASASGEFATVVRATDPIGQSATWQVTFVVTRNIATLYNASAVLQNLRSTPLASGQASISVWQGEVRVDAYEGAASQAARLMLPFAPGDFDGSGVVEFQDFFLMVSQNGKRPGDEGFLYRYDMNADGVISDPDIFIFADNFGKTGRGVAAKMAVIPDDPPSESMRSAWEILKQGARRRAAKIAVQDTRYVFRVRSLSNGFAPLDSVFSDVFTDRQNIVLKVNTVPIPESLTQVRSANLGDSIRVALVPLFLSDDQLMFSFVGDSSGFAIQDSVLVGRATELGTFSANIRATDGASQAADTRFTLEVTGDLTLPQVSLQRTGDNNIRLASQDNSGSVAVRITRNNTIVVFSGTRTSPFDTTLALSGFGLGTHVFQAEVTDASGNTVLSDTVAASVAMQFPAPRVSLDAPASVQSLTIANNLDQLPILVMVEVNGAVRDSITISTSLASWPFESYLPDGSSTVRLVARVQGTTSTLYEGTATRPDRTGPSIEIENVEWAGTQLTECVFVLHIFDTMSDVMAYGLFVPSAGYDHSGVASQMNSRFSMVVSFSTVGGATNHEFRLRARDRAGNLTEKSVYVTQPTSPAPPPPPPPPPPPTNVAPTISSATVNGAGSGTLTVAAGSSLALAASFSGTPTPTATWTLASQSTSGSSASLTAQSGTLTLTVSNSAGSVSRTWTIVTLGAP